MAPRISSLRSRNWWLKPCSCSRLVTNLLSLAARKANLPGLSIGNPKIRYPRAGSCAHVEVMAMEVDRMLGIERVVLDGLDDLEGPAVREMLAGTSSFPSSVACAYHSSAPLISYRFSSSGKAELPSRTYCSVGFSQSTRMSDPLMSHCTSRPSEVSALKSVESRSDGFITASQVLRNAGCVTGVLVRTESVTYGLMGTKSEAMTAQAILLALLHLCDVILSALCTLHHAIDQPCGWNSGSGVRMRLAWTSLDRHSVTPLLRSCWLELSCRMPWKCTDVPLCCSELFTLITMVSPQDAVNARPGYWPSTAITSLGTPSGASVVLVISRFLPPNTSA
ncbi:hypothetical protein KC364_g7 [Hortaea werneckii]|nr:hypothetical protein KC364_g7 [Hortaea werneckii]